MARALHRTTPSKPFFRFVRSLSLKASSPHAGSNACVFTGTFTKADHGVSRTLTLVRFQPKASASSLGPCSARLRVNTQPCNTIPFTTVNMTPLGKQGTNHFRVWSQAIPTHVAVSVEQVMKVPEEVLRALDSDDFPHVYKRADTLDLVKGHLDGSSGDAVVEILQVSLLCPLSPKRMKVPCRGVHCRHVQCFDAYAYLAANESTMKPFWRCPVCDLALPVEDMWVHLFTLDVLGKAEEHSDHVRFFADGQWENVAAGKDDHSVIVIEDSSVKPVRKA